LPAAFLQKGLQFGDHFQVLRPPGAATYHDEAHVVSHQ